MSVPGNRSGSRNRCTIRPHDRKHPLSSVPKWEVVSCGCRPSDFEHPCAHYAPGGTLKSHFSPFVWPRIVVFAAVPSVSASACLVFLVIIVPGCPKLTATTARLCAVRRIDRCLSRFLSGPNSTHPEVISRNQRGASHFSSDLERAQGARSIAAEFFAAPLLIIELQCSGAFFGA